MKKSMLSMTLLAVLAAGCSDPQAAEHIRVRQTHDQVDALLSQAQLSYVPGDQPVEVRRADWRHDKQAAAIKELAGVLQEGAPRQQVTTRRLLADLHDSSARQDVYEGVAAWTAHANESALLLSHLLSVDRADAQVRRFGGDASKLLAQVRAQVAQLQRQQATHQKELAQWQAKAKDLTAQAATHNEQAAQANARASVLRQQAFTAAGKERLATYEQAAQASIASNQAGAQAQQVEAQLDLAKSQAAILNQQVTLIRQAATQVQAQIKAIEAGQAAQAQSRDKAQKDKDQAVETLDAELTRVVAGFQAVTDNHFTPASQQLDQAIELLNGAMGLAGGDRVLKEGVQMDLLARQVSKLHLLSVQASAAGDLARKLQVVAQIAADDKRPGGALIPAKATFYNTTLQSVVEARDQAISQADALAKEAADLVSVLSQGDETLAKQAGDLGNLARRYRDLAAASKD